VLVPPKLYEWCPDEWHHFLAKTAWNDARNKILIVQQSFSQVILAALQAWKNQPGAKSWEYQSARCRLGGHAAAAYAMGGFVKEKGFSASLIHRVAAAKFRIRCFNFHPAMPALKRRWAWDCANSKPWSPRRENVVLCLSEVRHATGLSFHARVYPDEHGAVPWPKILRSLWKLEAKHVPGWARLLSQAWWSKQ